MPGFVEETAELEVELENINPQLENITEEVDCMDINQTSGANSKTKPLHKRRIKIAKEVLNKNKQLKVITVKSPIANRKGSKCK